MFVDVGLEALECQDELYLFVNLPISALPSCCSRQFVGVESAGRVSRWLCELSLNPLSFFSPMANLPTACLLVQVRAYFGIPIAI